MALGADDVDEEDESEEEDSGDEDDEDAQARKLSSEQIRDLETVVVERWNEIASSGISLSEYVGKFNYVYIYRRSSRNL